ncbi:MAG: HAMP domain-containing histidine kinase [Bacteroidetes bacterium]|nr:HAMP domain-containing histidine kinase [Bacteroidota bacterium]MBP6640393.1 HAMP domain-containing histidine kinase [Bacteroidia bacterium]
MQIRTRLTVQFAMIVATILLVTVSILYYSTAQYRRFEFFTQLRGKATTTSDLFLRVPEVDSTLLRLIDRNKRDVLPSESINIYNSANEIVYTTNDARAFQTTPAELDKIRKLGEVQSEYGDFEVIGLHCPSPGGDYVVTAGAIDNFGKNKLRKRQLLLLTVFLGGLIVVGIAGWVFAGRALKPINDIVARMKQISASNLDARLDEGNRTDEIARLAQTFNKMLTRLENAFNLQKTFVANISHELKNPLTAITSQLEVSLLRERDNADYQRTLESVLEDIQKLNRAASSLLDLASLNTDQVQLTRSPLRIDELLWICREQLLGNHPEFHVEMDMDLPEDAQRLMVNGNDHLLGIAFTNLMENGCKFSDSGAVKLTLKTAPYQISLVFQNHGIGILAEDLDNIFQPFYRGKNTISGTGHGIGLSLVRRIFDLHGAELQVSSDKENGTQFQIKMPTIASSNPQ